MYLKAYTNPNSLPFTNNPLKTSQEAEQLLKYVSNLNKNPENLISTFKLFLIILTYNWLCIIIKVSSKNFTSILSPKWT